METAEKVIVVVSFILVPALCYCIGKKTDQWSYSWKDIIWIILFAYLWSFLNIFIHECGHALTARSFGIVADKVSVGAGWKLFSVGGGNYTKMTFRIFPVDGYTYTEMGSVNQEIVILAMGVITQFIFLGLIYWLLKKNRKWQENIIGHFCYHMPLKLLFD